MNLAINAATGDAFTLAVVPIYMVAIVEDGVIARYQQHDGTGAVHFTTTMANAKHYTDKALAFDFVDRLNEESNTGMRIQEGGKRYPSSDVMKALNIRETVGKKRIGAAIVMEFTPAIVKQAVVHGAIQEPIGYTYEDL